MYNVTIHLEDEKIGLSCKEQPTIRYEDAMPDAEDPNTDYIRIGDNQTFVVLSAHLMKYYTVKEDWT